MGISARAQFVPRNDLGQFIPARIEPAVRAAVQASCQLIEDRAKQLAPVDTGALRDSISSEVHDGDKTVVGTVAPHVPYADYVEFGTGIRGAASAGAGAGPYSSTWPGMPAQPYMRPALDESRDAIKEVFRGQIGLAVRT